jgi:DNA-binding MarR family transcriptional regulator
MPANRSKARGRKQLDPTTSILRHWREAVPDDRLAHLVRDAGRSFVRALQIRLMEHSVSFGHWAFLRVLWENDGLTQRELSLQTGLMEPTAFTALKSMERLGYIRRMQRPDNRKSVYIFLTPKGRQLKAKLVPLAEEVNDIAVRDIARADVQATRRTLLAIIENLATDASRGGSRRLPSTRELARLVEGTG